MKSTESLGQEIASLSAHLDAATHRLLECIREFDRANGWHEQGAASCAHWLAWRVGLDAATAREKVRVARALGELPAIDEAFRTARLSYAKVRALTRVATIENEQRLLAMALVATGAQLERLCRGYRSVTAESGGPRPEERSVRRRVLPDGMVELRLVLEADEAELVMLAIGRAREVRAEDAAAAPKEALVEATDVSAETPRTSRAWPTAADGAVGVAESYLAGHPVSGTAGERYQVVIRLEQEALGPDGSMAATLEDGTHVSAETLRRVACDCALVAGDGETLNIGRRTRSIPPALRRALRLRDGGCVFPGCTNTRYLHGHHIKHWLNGGETSLENTLLLCSFHHRLVHEGGWSISVQDDGAPVFHAPAGEPLARMPRREPVDDAVAWLRGVAAERGLDLGPEVNAPRWDGKAPDYGLAVECLLAG